MTKPKKSYKYSCNARSLSTMLLAVGLWCIGMFASMGMLVPVQVYAQSDDSIPGGDVTNPAIRAVDIAKPAVVRILTDVPSHLTVHFPPTTDVSFPQQSNGNYHLAVTGAGTFISSQGDVLTADSVVEPPQDQVLNPGLYSAAAQDVANYMNQNGLSGSTQETVDDVVQKLTSGKLPSTPVYNSPTSVVYLSAEYAGTYAQSDLNSVPSNLKATVDTIKAHSPPDQDDLAIVHVPMTDTPSVALGNSDNVQQQDQLKIMGFVSSADASPKPQTFLASSIRSANVISKDSGTSTIQIDIKMDNGNDGGPALNSEGKIVGVMRAAVSNGNTTGGDTSILQASSSVLKLTQGIDMTPGAFQKLWSQAFEDYGSTAAGHWHKAEQEFTQLAQNYRQFQAVQQFLNYAQTQAKTENLVTATPTQVQHRSSSPTPSAAGAFGLAAWQLWAVVIAAAVLLLVFVVTVFAAAVRRRERRNRFRPDVVGVKGVSTIVKPKPSESVTGQSPALGGVGQDTLALKIWPCGHMNRPNARFCSICGEAAPTQ
jgi:serine protease Do